MALLALSAIYSSQSHRESKAKGGKHIYQTYSNHEIQLLILASKSN